MAKAERPDRRRLPLEMLVIGAACLVCCLPLLGGLVAVASGLLAGLGATWLGTGLGIAIGMALAVVAVIGVLRWWSRRRVRCSTCGGTACASLGQRVQALRQYQLCERLLRQTFDAVPEPATRALFDRLRLDPEGVLGEEFARGLRA
jgi:Flp pilus assembly protein TadB